MFLDGFSPSFDGDLFTGDLFEFSPAESLVNFELPSSFTSESYQISDHLNLDSDTFANSVSDRTNYDEVALFDFADLDKNVDLDHYLSDAFNSDSSDAVQHCSSDCNDSDDGLGRLSVLGIDLDSTATSRAEEAVTSICLDDIALRTDHSETEISKACQWGEPEFCSEYSAFRCPVTSCGKLYAKASHVRVHLRRHSGEKPYRCTWNGCAWKFARSDELARHRRSHSGDKPYRCDQCDKRFSRSDHLAKHARVHARRAAAAALAAAAAASASAKRNNTYNRSRRYHLLV